jgi:hypothetical protein
MKIRDIMNFIYDELIEFAPVYYEDMKREKDGSIKLESTNIVYNLEGMYKVSEINVRKDIPLIIDIWHLKEDLFEIEDMIYQIDKRLSDVTVNIDDKAFKISKDTAFLTNVPDPDLNIRRKRLRYVIKYYNH